ncbi:M23 family metallopeptidase [Thalassotalea sp. PP2-459]|uniref:M23 family metallopeptidase n=1 Tax=Thalassotalea sp. PP2-459 TaxID=1742724 RepID=UPI0009427F63|nr:M23 family metallopeptidase [Thalassotalea sp. PP2-459]OKY25800.1 peptidase [Thalassotalea sp. PP2-459]
MLNYSKYVSLAAGFLLSTSITISASAQEVTLKGVIKQGGLIIGKTIPNSKVSLNGEPLLLSDNGDFVFGFSRDEAKTKKLVVEKPDGTVYTKTLTPKKQQYNIQRVEGIAKKIMNPDPNNVKRAKKDAEQVYLARNKTSHRLDFTQGFIAPATGTITGVYGSQRFYNGKPGRPHYGLDYAGPTGTPVIAPASGIVTLYVPDMFYSGGTMIIDHGHGVTSTFLHLSDSFVKEGDTVNKGDKVAAIGATGRATGPHLDWRINWKHVKLDPALALKAFE